MRNVGEVQVSKVKAHQNLDAIVDPTDRWKAVMNDKADRLAKACIQKTWKNVANDINRNIGEREHNILMLKRFHSFWHDVNVEALKLCTKDDTARAHLPAYVPRHVPENLVKMSCVVPRKAIQQCRFGDVFAERVVNTSWVRVGLHATAS